MDDDFLSERWMVGGWRLCFVFDRFRVDELLVEAAASWACECALRSAECFDDLWDMCKCIQRLNDLWTTLC